MTNSLAGFTIGITADRRREELAALLQRRGARVVMAPALRIVPLADDTELRGATLACLDQPPDVVIANTGIGMRGWLEAAEGWGLVEPLKGGPRTGVSGGAWPEGLRCDPGRRAAGPLVPGLREL
jgi:uroporphyrinogen-III synthase